MNKTSIARAIVILHILFRQIEASAQIPAGKEPHHKTVFENQYIRILDGQIPVGDTTLVHRHSSSSVVIFLTHSTFGIQILGDTAVIAEVRPGDIKFAGYDEKPVTHIVWNQGSSLFHFLVVEIVDHPASADSCRIPPFSGLQNQWQNAQVKAYVLKFDQGTEYRLQKSACAFLFIGISGSFESDSSGNTRQIKPNDFIFFPPQSNIHIKSGRNQNGRGVLLQVR
jgi:hypothetical protein